jgi:hypothetical protein
MVLPVDPPVEGNARAEQPAHQEVRGPVVATAARNQVVVGRLVKEAVDEVDRVADHDRPGQSPDEAPGPGRVEQNQDGQGGGKDEIGAAELEPHTPPTRLERSPELAV